MTHAGRVRHGGGGSGAPGENRIERAAGTVEVLGAIGQAEMLPGDVFVIATPAAAGTARSEGRA